MKKTNQRSFTGFPRKSLNQNHTIKKTEGKTQIKSRCYSKQQKAQPVPSHSQGHKKNKIDQLMLSSIDKGRKLCINRCHKY